jgi:hypothetical protein
LPGRGNSALEISRAGEHTRIVLHQPDLIRSQTVENGVRQAVIELAQEPNLLIDGAPSLPHVSRLYRISNTGGVDLRIYRAEFTTEADVFLAPYASGADVAQSVFETNAWYPAEPVALSAPMIFRDFRVVQVTLYPVQYNPVTHELRTYSDLDVELVPNSEPGENELLHPRRPSGAFATIYRDLIPNLDPAALDNQTTIPGGYLILCRNQATALQFADSLARWKKLRGYNVGIDALANWSAAQMRVAIQTAYGTWDPPLEYVTIIGDPQNGQFGLPTDGGSYDHSFALGNTGDEIEDIAVGRFSASNASELATMMNKLFIYERNPELTDTLWTRRAFMYAGIGQDGPRNHNVVRWQRDQFLNFTALDSIHTATHSGGVNDALVRSEINRGLGFFIWTGTWIGQMQPSLAGSCSTSHRLPVVMAITEGTGNFADGLAISESWHTAGTPANPKGGVCAIGMATSGVHQPQANSMTCAFVYNVCNLEVENVGVALAGAKAHLVSIFGSDSPYFNNSSRWTNLMGDPSLAMWTDRPRELTAELPTQITPHTNCISADIHDLATGEPVADALIVLLSNTNTIAKILTDAQGHADLPFAALVADSMRVAITKRNFAPWLGMIRVVAAPVDVTAGSFALDDDNQNGTQGNSNQLLNPGETVEFPVYFRNGGTTTVSLVNALVTCSNPHVTLLTSEMSCVNLAPGDSVLAAPRLRVRVGSAARFEECVLLRVAMDADATVSCSVIQEVVHAAELEYDAHDIVGGDGDELLEPGETAQVRISLRNLGDVSSQGSDARLISRTPAVTVTAATTQFGFIAPNGVGNSQGSALELRAHALSYPGTLAHFWLLINATNFTDTVAFSIPLGQAAVTDPSGPDAFGYFAYENVDTGYSQARPYNWVNIRGVGLNLQLHDPGEEHSSDPVNSLVRDLPFPFIFYGEEYTQMTICSNGWAAFGDHTGMDQHMNYPLPGQQAPDALLAPFWDDLRTGGSDGVGVWDYYDQDSARYVIQWNAFVQASNTPEQFEIVLLDPAIHASSDGSGIVIFQYFEVADVIGDQFTDVPYATVGIQAPGCLDGLQMRFSNAASSGASELIAGRAMTFTTDGRVFTGSLSGYVVNEYTHEVIADAMVSIAGDSQATDRDGAFSFPQLTAGFYSLRARAEGYAGRDIASIAVFADSTTQVLVELTPEVGADDPPRVPARFALLQNVPNPFNNSTEIQFELPAREAVKLEVYNVTGQLRATLIDGVLAAGAHTVRLSGADFGTGIYFYRLESPSGMATKKLVLLK